METVPGLLQRPDPGALSAAQLEQLRKFKIQTRIANEKYLRTNKEVEWLISGFFRFICESTGPEAVATACLKVYFTSHPISSCFPEKYF
nr:RIIa domain-containing protein 1 isoform X6 [Pongo abelii]